MFDEDDRSSSSMSLAIWCYCLVWSRLPQPGFTETHYGANLNVLLRGNTSVKFAQIILQRLKVASALAYMFSREPLLSTKTL